MNVGTKELKNRLSHYLRRVRAGERVVVTDHGVPIAEIRSLSTSIAREDRAALKELAAEGIVTLGRGRLRDIEPIRLRGGTRLSEMVIEDRR